MKTEEYIWVSNHQINDVVKKDIKDFIELTTHVEALRTREILRFTTYPTSKSEYNNNLRFWDYLNKNRNSLNDNEYFIFNVRFPKSLYNLLRFSKKTKIKNYLELSIALKYIIEPEKRKNLRTQVYEPIFDKAMNIVDKYFYDYLPSSLFCQKNIDSNPGFYFTQLKKQAEKVYNELIGNSSMFNTLFCLDGNFIIDIKLETAYMSSKDWETVILKNEKDSLDRIESKKEMIEMWRFDLLNEFAELNNCDEII